MARANRRTGPAAIGRAGASALIGFTVLGAVFSSRFGVSLPGFNADISLVTILAPLVAMATVVRVGSSQALGFLHNSAFVFMVAPFLVLMAVLPWLGVFFNGREVTTLYALTSVTTFFSFLVIGAAVSATGVKSWSSWLAIAVVLQFLYAVGQAALLEGGAVAEVLRPIREWDLAVAGDDYLIRGRSSGFYSNPNVLGFWATVATVVALTLTSSTVRPVVLALALLTLVLSQSRGATAAMLVVAAVGTLGALVLGRIPRSQPRALAGAALLLALFIPVALIAMPSQSFDRFDALISVFSEGAGADQNLAGRVEFWVAAVDLSRQYPLGTWGPPEGVLGTAVDSDWFRAFAQGSIVLVFAHVLLLLAPCGAGSYPGRYALWLLAVVIAVAGITQTAMSYPPAILYFALLGSALQWSVDHRRQRPPVVPRVRAVSRYSARDRTP